MAPNKRRGRRRGRSTSAVTTWVEHYNGTTHVGVTTSFVRRNLEFAADRQFKVISYAVEAVSNGPVTVQLRGYGPQSAATEICCSGVYCVGVIPRRRVLRVNSPWFPTDTSGDRVLAAFDVMCDKAGEQDRIIKYAMTVTLRLSPEKVPSSCPKTLENVPTEAFNARLLEGNSSGCDAAAGWDLA